MTQPNFERAVAWAVIDFAAYLTSTSKLPDSLDLVPLLTAWAEQNGLSLEHASADDWDRFLTHICSTSQTPSGNS
jgi:hypothetical protein